MPLVFHEMGHNPAGTEAKASVDVFLKEGVKSQKLLRQEGKLPPKENPYEIAIKKKEEWIQGRKDALKDNPALLETILQSAPKWGGGIEEFYKPGFSGHREENVFFGYNSKPSKDRDWVAMEVPDTTRIHDASCRDRGNPQLWENGAVTIREFEEAQKSNSLPNRWESKYNELLIPNQVHPNKIVAYAKVEKELPITRQYTEQELQQVQKLLSHKLSFATQFDNPESNILLNIPKDTKKGQIRVSFNKAKVSGREQEVSKFFGQFTSMDQLVEKAKEFNKSQEQTVDRLRSTLSPSTTTQTSSLDKELAAIRASAQSTTIAQTSNAKSSVPQVTTTKTKKSSLMSKFFGKMKKGGIEGP